METRDCFVAPLLAMTFFYVHILTKRCTKYEYDAQNRFCNSSTPSSKLISARLFLIFFIWSPISKIGSRQSNSKFYPFIC
uniref:Uncharacterized protein n=1 Tax=Kuenenia stuttgartiensis TaxID=174633 RepID=Q1Q321_KUEST|nr:unknown protein [Candidatus Kuenenia stuttgartiensis]